MAEVALSNVGKSYGAVVAVRDFNLTVADREFVVLVGPSGCGKSTTLRMVAGLEEITAGAIAIGGRVVNHLPPKDRDIAMVFQNYALYQHMSVRDNLAFGLRNRHVPESEIDVQITRAVKMLGIEALLVSATVTSTKFIDGEPMKPATNRLAGFPYSSSGSPTCWIQPSFMTTTRSPSVIASTWSWVT